MANEAVRHLKDAEFRAFLEEKSVALVDFWASWCGPCRMVGPTIEQLAQEYEGRASVGKVNVDEEGGLAGDFGVMSIPCKRVSRRSLRTGSAVSKRQNQTGSFVASV